MFACVFRPLVGGPWRAFGPLSACFSPASHRILAMSSQRAFSRQTGSSAPDEAHHEVHSSSSSFCGAPVSFSPEYHSALTADLPFEIRHLSTVKGRGCFATRDIAEDELVFMEAPLFCAADPEKLVCVCVCVCVGVCASLACGAVCVGVDARGVPSPLLTSLRHLTCFPAPLGYPTL
jgi:hypothetical protein